jgi:RNAse (barnase) inhibitor barstar
MTFGFPDFYGRNMDAWIDCMTDIDVENNEQAMIAIAPWLTKDMKNKWRTAFWTLLTVYILTTLFLLYSILDQGETITYMRKGYGDTEHDLEQVSQIIKGKLTFEDFKEITDTYPDLGDSTSIELNRIKIDFGTDKKVISVTTNW